MMYILKFLGVMLSMFLVDICWAKYFLWVNKHHPLRAATWGSLILVFGAFTTINYVDDKTLLIAAVIGGFAGSYYAVNKEKNGQNNRTSN